MRETIMSMVEELGNDAEMEVFGNTISIWLIDFDEWDDDWQEFYECLKGRIKWKR